MAHDRPLGRFPSQARIATLWRNQMVHSDRYPRFLVSLAFLATFLSVRGLTYGLRRRQTPVARETHQSVGLRIGNVHIHHLVGGILLLLVTGYLAINREQPRPRNRLALLYGIGAALTLDEFALWLRLEDVYWAREGRESIDAGVVAGATFTLAALGQPFLQAVFHEWRQPASPPK